ncbi:MAG: glutathione binding-like protein [Pseudomonadota bacterium]
MGMMIQGEWTESTSDPRMQDGKFVRQASQFTRIKSSAPPRPRPGRIHLFSSWSCPWSQRAMIARNLKGLEGTITMSGAWGPRIEGYSISNGDSYPIPGAGKEARFLHEVYRLSLADYTGRVTVPVLWDADNQEILSNESSDIVRWFNMIGDDTENTPDLFPIGSQEEIEILNAKIYHGLTNAVYEAGNAERQDVYEEKARLVAETLLWLNEHLSDKTYILSDAITVCDVYLVPSLLRFTAIYEQLFKCNLVPLRTLPNVCRYVHDMMEIDAIRKTLDLPKAKLGYYLDKKLNPTMTIPLGPTELEWRTG